MMLQALIIDILIVFSLFGLGFMLLKVVHPASSRLQTLSLSFPLGSGLLTWLLFLAGWIGLPFDRLEILLLWIGAAAILFLLARRRAAGRWFPGPMKLRPGSFEMAAAVALGVIILGSVVIAVGRSYSMYDAIAMWAPKGYGIALERSIWGARWGNHGLSYPLNIHFLIAVFRIFSGDVLPGSKSLFPLLFASLLVGMIDYWRTAGVRPSVRLAGLLLTAAVPTLFLHATVGYANLPMAVYLVLGTFLGIRGIEDGRKELQILSGIFFGLTAWTIIEGVLYVGIVLAGLLIARWISRRGRVFLIPWFAPILLIAGSWFAFYRIYGYEGSQVMNASSGMLGSLLRGELHLEELRLIFGFARRNIFSLPTWGLIYPLGMLMILVGWRQLLPKASFQGFALACAMILTGLLSLGLFYLRSFDIPGLYDLLVRGFPRGFITPTLFMAVLAIQCSKSIWPASIQAPNKARAGSGPMG
jgi:hypothetical protein